MTLDQHTYSMSTEETPDGDVLYRATCLCGWRSRGWLEMYAADDEALLHGASYWGHD